MTQVSFSPPGPGSWQRDAVHFPRPMTKLFAEVFPVCFDAGFREGVRVYGSLLETLEFRTVNSYTYFAARPVGAPKNAAAPPPKFVFKLLLTLHPEMRRRIASARETFAAKRWRQDLRVWDEERKPASIRTNLALQAVAPATLGTQALDAHVEKCYDHWRKMIVQHHRFDCAAILPAGDFIAHAASWTGLEPARLCTLLSGASDVSRGASPQFDRLQAALRSDPASRGLLDDSKSPAGALRRLREAAGELGDAARSWLDLVSYRLQDGLDICEPTNAEAPEFLLATIRRALGRSDAPPRNTSERNLAAVRERVPARHRAEFDELLAEARLTSRLRDERALYSDIWAAGILRLSLLEAGRRLAADGRIERPELLLDAGWDEIREIFQGGTRPSSTALAERANYRSTASRLDVPDTLGPAFAGPPPAQWMPAFSARAEQAVAMVISGIFAESPAKNEPRVVRGLGVSPGTFEGTARIVREVSAFCKLQQGDILVTSSTTAAFNVILHLLGGIVTDRGGTLSHSAIVAREYGIPAVVGSRDATRVIPDGARIRIDGTLGEVRVL